MATDKEYKAVIDALSGECERLHKENEELKKALENHETFMKYAYSQGKQDALSQEPCDDAVSREAVIKDFTQWRGKMAYSFGEDYSGVSVLDKAIRVIKDMPSVTPKSIECDDAISRILERMWNCRGKHTTSIDKVKMEQIIREELPAPYQKGGKE